MSERRKKTSLSTSLHGEPTLEETNSTLDNEYEQSSDLFRLVNKSNKSNQGNQQNRILRATGTKKCLPKVILPKLNPKSLAKDKTVCSEEELKEIEKKDEERKRKSPSKSNYGNQLNLNKPYLKSATDFKLERKKK